MAEPVITIPNPAGTGRPPIADEQFMQWLLDMAPFLKQGVSLNYAMERTGLMNHERTIREKYKSNDWFARKIDAYRATVGEMVNLVGTRIVENINKRMIESDGKVGIVSTEELQVWKVMAEKHRSAQPFFVNRVENAAADDTKLGKIIDQMESTDYDDLARQAQEQVVAANAPVQDKEQAGEAGNVQTQSDPVTPPSGQGESSV